MSEREEERGREREREKEGERGREGGRERGRRGNRGKGMDGREKPWIVRDRTQISLITNTKILEHL